MQTRSKSAAKADTVDDVKAFYDKNPQLLDHYAVDDDVTMTTTQDPAPIGKYMEIICSSGQQHIGSHLLQHRAYRLFSYPTQSVGFEHEVEWPRRTDVCCWHDGEPFDTVPICIPKCIDPRTKRYAVYGCFCSLNCALKYMQDRDRFNTMNSSMHLLHVARTVFGLHIPLHQRVVQAPDFFYLKKFGGHMTIDEFRNRSQVATSVITLVPPFISFSHVLEDNAENTGEVVAERQKSFRHKIRGLRRPVNPQKEPPHSPKKTSNGPLYTKYLSEKKSVQKTQKTNATSLCREKRKKTGGLQKFLKK